MHTRTKGIPVFCRQNPASRPRPRLSYANIASSLALFLALGGTAAAAVTLPRDSVGAPQIRKDAVRSPEIQRDAVRSSEIRDDGIRLADISDGARSALRGTEGTANVRIAEKEFAEVPACASTDLRDCPDLLTLSLGSAAPDDARKWLVQAKLAIGSPDGTGDSSLNHCALVQAENQAPTAITDDVHVDVLPTLGAEVVALSGVVTERARNPLMALRCNVQQFDDLEVEDMTITAIEVGTLTGP
jgi:hypothetical protein